MTISFDEVRLREIVESARDCRMKQLESDFASWKDYADAVNAKENLADQLEALLTIKGKERLEEYDDVYSLMVCKAQDYFYKQGFKMTA